MLDPFHNASCIRDRICNSRRVGRRVARDGSQLSCGQNRGTDGNDGGFSRFIHGGKDSIFAFCSPLESCYRNRIGGFLWRSATFATEPRLPKKLDPFECNRMLRPRNMRCSSKDLPSMTFSQSLHITSKVGAGR